MPSSNETLNVKKVGALPGTLDANTLYFVKDVSNNVTIHITDKTGSVAYQGGSGLTLQQVLDALGTSASHDVSSTGDALSTQVVLGDDSRLDHDLSTYRLNLDSMGLYTTIEYKRANGTLAKRSVLSGGTTPEYTTRTETTYKSDGTTVLKTVVFALTYYNGKLLNEVIQP